MIPQKTQKAQKQRSRGGHPSDPADTNTQKLLLHTCCAVCAEKAVTDLRKSHTGEITFFFANSNIHPRTEYLARLNAVRTLADRQNIPLIIDDWSPKQWFNAIGHDPANAGLRRCRLCWRMRLEHTRNAAEHHGFQYFSSTLLASHYQNRQVLVEEGRLLETGNLTFLPVSRSAADSETAEKGLYHQNYCGCVYSLRDRYEGKWGVE